MYISYSIESLDHNYFSTDNMEKIVVIKGK